MRELMVIDSLVSDEETLSWQERSLCAQTDPEAFFPEKGLHPRGQEGLHRVRGPIRSAWVCAGQRRALRHLGRPLRARASQAQEAGRLSGAAAAALATDDVDPV